MGKLARMLSTQTGVSVEASYDPYRSTHGWRLTWCDGPTVETMRKRAVKAARGMANVEATELRYIRTKTELAIVVAFLAYVLPRPAVLANPPIEALYAHENTDFPGAIGPELWTMARFAMDKIGGQDVYEAGRETMRYIAKIGINGLRLDMWLLTAGGQQSDCQPSPPVVTPDVLSEDVRCDLARVLNRVQAELAGGSAHSDDPRVQLVVAEATRQLLLDQVNAHQRRTAAQALADGIGLSSLSTMIGLSPRTLGMRFGKADLEAEVAPLTWLRDNAAEWVAACEAAARAVQEAPDFYSYSDVRRVLWTLERAEPAGGWRELTDTPGAARALLALTRKYPPRGAEDALHHLERLLESYERAEPPTRRERALRRPITSAAPPRIS